MVGKTWLSYGRQRVLNRILVPFHSFFDMDPLTYAELPGSKFGYP